MKNKKETRNFLIGQGCDTNFAEYLSHRYSIEQLKEKSEEELKELGLRAAVADAMKKGREAIPSDMLDTVLQKNIRICCVCYNDAGSVILHHIKPYAEEKNTKNLTYAYCVSHVTGKLIRNTNWSKI